jgi:RNA recognition motif-containing protein
MRALRKYVSFNVIYLETMDQEVDDLLYGSFEEPGIVDAAATEEKTAPVISLPETGSTDQRMTPQTIQSQEESQQKVQSQGRGKLLNPNFSKQGKMFIGGLSWETTDDGLRNYMKVYGEIEDVLIMKDSFTNRSRGFAFLTFTDPASIDKVLQTDHYIDGKKVPLVINKKIDPKRAVPKEEYERAEKMFVGGVPDISDREFKEFFGKFGVVTEANVMFDRNTGRPRGFGFVTFANWDGVQNALYAQASRGIFLMGKRVRF